LFFTIVKIVNEYRKTKLTAACFLGRFLTLYVPKEVTGKIHARFTTEVPNVWSADHQWSFGHIQLVMGITGIKKIMKQN
jgi:hypothetical protein